MLKASLIVIFLFFIFSCTQKKENQSSKQVLELGTILENPKNNDAVFSDIRYVRLETLADNLLGDNLYFHTGQNKLYILDRSHQKALLTFNSEGKYLGKTGKQGNGPEEYTNTIDFVVRGDTIDFLSAGAQQFIYSYLYNGQFIKKTNIKFYAGSFQLVDDKFYAISTNWNKSLHDHQIYLLNKNGEEVKKMHPNNTSLDMSIGENCFTSLGEKVYYFEPFNNKVYELDTDTLFPVYELDFGKYNIPEEFFKTDVMKGFELINKQGFSMIRNVFINRENIVFEIVRQKEGQAGNLYLITFNKKSGEIKHLTLTEDNFIFRYPIGLNDKNEMMYLVFPMGDVNQEFKKFGLEPDISSFKESDNPLIVYCKMKNV